MYSDAEKRFAHRSPLSLNSIQMALPRMVSTTTAILCQP